MIAALAGLGATGVAACDSRLPHPAPAQPPADPRDLNPAGTATLFQPSTRHRLQTGDIAVAEVLRADTLKLPTGRLLAVDPSWLPPLNPTNVGPRRRRAGGKPSPSTT